MRVKLKSLLGGVIAFLLICSPVFAAGINVHLTGLSGSGFAYDHNGTASGNKLSTNSVIQWLSIKQPPDPADAVNFLHSGTPNPNYSGNIGNGTGDLAGTFDKNSNAVSTSYLRFWENGGPGADKYYYTSGPYSVGDPLPTENYQATFQTKYKAAKPLKPTSTAGGFSLAYNDAKTVYLPSFSISAIDAADPDGKTLYEVVGRNIRIRKKGDQWVASRTFAASSKQITETNPDSQYYIADGVTEYEIQSQAWNYFGGNADADWGPIYTFTIPSSGGVAGPGEPSIVTFSLPLYAPQADKLVVNLIASPIQMKASSLVSKINITAGKDVVVAISKSLPGEGSYAVYIPGDKATLDFTINAGEGVQVYLTQAVPGFKLDNQLTNQ